LSVIGEENPVWRPGRASGRAAPGCCGVTGDISAVGGSSRVIGGEFGYRAIRKVPGNKKRTEAGRPRFFKKLDVEVVYAGGPDVRL
jgi:hypothetical protein